MKMDAQEYQDKLKVRTQLSLADKFRVLEHEFEMLLERVRAIENDLSDMKTITPTTADGPFK